MCWPCTYVGSIAFVKPWINIASKGLELVILLIVENTEKTKTSLSNYVNAHAHLTCCSECFTHSSSEYENCSVTFCTGN